MLMLFTVAILVQICSMSLEQNTIAPVPMERQGRSTLSPPEQHVPRTERFDTASHRDEQFNQCAPMPVVAIRNCHCEKFGGHVHSQIKHTGECCSPYPDCFLCGTPNRSMYFCPNLCFHLKDWVKFTQYLTTKHSERAVSLES